MADATQEECWAPIPGYEGFYEASDCGKVRSLDRVLTRGNGTKMKRRGQLIRGVTVNGYQVITLRKPGDGGLKIGAHRLVLLTFVGPCPEGHEALHGNGDRQDNRLANLRWGTRSENMQDAIAHGTNYALRKERCPRGHILEEPNLVPWHRDHGRRSCRACSLTHDKVGYARRVGNPVPNFGDFADGAYWGLRSAHYEALRGSG